jgi:hypothetical protein
MQVNPGVRGIAIMLRTLQAKLFQKKLADH